LAAYLLIGLLVGAVPVLGPHAYARQQDTGFLNGEGSQPHRLCSLRLISSSSLRLIKL
jgi:hypothetical protein